MFWSEGGLWFQIGVSNFFFLGDSWFTDNFQASIPRFSRKPKCFADGSSIWGFDFRLLKKKNAVEWAETQGIVDLQKLGKEYGFDTALLTSLPSALSKAGRVSGVVFGVFFLFGQSWSDFFCDFFKYFFGTKWLVAMLSL